MIRAAPSILLAALLLACAAGAPSGPFFEPHAGPTEGRALVYVYRRDDALRSGSLRLRIDARSDVGPTSDVRLMNGEYAAFEVDPGVLELALTLQTAWGFPQGWNRMRLGIPANSTVYVRVWADFAEPAAGPAADQAGDFAAPGRASRQASLNVFATRRSAADALPEIGACRRVKAPAVSPATD